MSDNFCGQCGTANDGGRFCRNCGAPLASETPAAPVIPPAPGEPLANPFANIVVTDLLRDLGALILLFGALALRWDVGHDGSDRWWVVIATVISALSLAIPYVVATGTVPGWGPAQSRLAKQVCAVPYLISVFAALVDELAHVGNLHAGVGAAVGVGLAGALLAAQPRAGDEDPAGTHDGTWRTACLALLGIGAATFTVTVLIFTVTHLDDFGDFAYAGYHPSLALAGSAVLAIGGYVVAVALPAAGVRSGSREWARPLATAGFVVVGVQFLAGASDSSDPLFGGVPMEYVKVYFGIFLIAAGVALVVARPVQRRLTTLDAVGTWISTARNACLVIAATLAMTTLARGLALIADDGTKADLVIQLVLTMLGAAAGLATRMVLDGAGPGQLSDPGRRAAVAIMGGTVLLGIVAIAVGRAVDASIFGRVSISPAEAVGWFGMPGLVLWSLLVPAAIRSAFQPLAGKPE